MTGVTDPHDHLNDDSSVQRNRLGRWMAAILSPIICILIFRFLGWLVGVILNIPTAFTEIPAVAGGVYIAIAFVLPLCIVRVPAGTAFLTIDIVSGWFGKYALVTYGPGTHPSYPWEQRDGKNNFSLEERSANFKSKILLKDGDITVSYGLRLRADIRNLNQFLTGAASATQDIEELINSVLIAELQNKTIANAMSDVEALNKTLRTKFKAEKTDFEHRFGVIVGDITIGEILPSEDVMKTKSGQAEMASLDTMVIDSLKRLHGIRSKKAWVDARNNGTITQNMIDDAMRRAQAATGNTDGMTIEEKRNRIEIALTGVSPEAAAAVTAAAPAVAALLNRQPAAGSTQTPAARTRKPKGSN